MKSNINESIASFPQGSVGLVVPQKVHFGEGIDLESGQNLPEFTLVVETYGNLNEAKSNGILVCHALSSSHHAAGFHQKEDKKPGWWDFLIGPGRPMDTNKFFIVCPNNIGGCHGSTGPLSNNPKTGASYGPDFPKVTVRDWVKSQAMLADYFGIQRWAAVAGGSLGGMQVMQWSIDYPERIENAVVIASAPRLSAQNIAFNEIARNAIRSDPDFCNGNYLEEGKIPLEGLKTARMVGHVTYKSDVQMRSKFDRELKSGDWVNNSSIEFQIESYLNYQGNTFSKQFDANSYILITKVLDYFDPARNYGNDLVQAFSGSSCNFLLISFSTDWRFPVARSEEICRALISAAKPVSHIVIDSDNGHDAFLIPEKRYQKTLKDFFSVVSSRIGS